MPELTDNLRKAAVEAVDKNKDYIDAVKADGEDPEMDMDNHLMQPMDNWDRVARKGHWGDSFLWVPSKKYKDRFDEIDWSK